MLLSSKLLRFVLFSLIPLSCVKQEDDNLSGTWLGKGYPCPEKLYHEQRVTIKETRDSLIGTKIDGDLCVSAGMVTFRGVRSGNSKRYNVIFTTGGPESPNCCTSNGTITIINSNTLEGIIERSRDTITYIRQ